MTDKPRLSTEELAQLGIFGHPTLSAAERLAQRQKLAADGVEIAAIRNDNRPAPRGKVSRADEEAWNRFHGVREASRVGEFVEPAKLETPYVKICDQIADHFDRLDRTKR
jgi:hypothetical protein